MEDNFNKMYYNQRTYTGLSNGDSNKIKWVGDTSKINVKYPDLADSKGKISFFYSDYGAELGGPTQYGAE